MGTWDGAEELVGEIGREAGATTETGIIRVGRDRGQEVHCTLKGIRTAEARS